MLTMTMGILTVAASWCAPSEYSHSKHSHGKYGRVVVRTLYHTYYAYYDHGYTYYGRVVVRT